MHQVNGHVDGIGDVYQNSGECVALSGVDHCCCCQFGYFGIHKESAKLLVPEWDTAVLTLAVVIPFGQSFSLTRELGYFFLIMYC